MIEKFTGNEGERRLVETLMDHSFIKSNKEIATFFAQNGHLLEINAGDAIIKQNEDDNDLYLIITGSVEVFINGRLVAQREAGKHIGEMALIDHAAKRSATVLAHENSVVLKLSEPKFTEIANLFPFLWRNLASELAGRLRQRGSKIKAPNELPELFIGSSAERLHLANAIQAGLSHDKMSVVVWTNGVFGASKTPIESLVNQLERADFALLILGDEDIVYTKGEELNSPRDNVIFELGLFIGKLGRERVYVVTERGANIKIPTDLLGVTFLDYPKENKNLSAALGPICHSIRTKVQELGSL